MAARVVLATSEPLPCYLCLRRRPHQLPLRDPHLTPAWPVPRAQRFVTLVAVVRGCSHLRGGAMTVGVERLGQHSDPAVEAYVQRLLRGACAPLLESLRRWLTDGELDDPCGEM